VSGERGIVVYGIGYSVLGIRYWVFGIRYWGLGFNFHEFWRRLSGLDTDRSMVIGIEAIVLEVCSPFGKIDYLRIWLFGARDEENANGWDFLR